MIRISKSPSITNATWLVFYVLTFVAIYFLSKYLLSYYIYGDQFHYTNFYYAVRGASATDVPALQFSLTGSAEPFYGYMIWVASNASIEKTSLISFFNGIFAVLTAATIRKLDGSIGLVAITFSNYYFIVLLTAAERLKFSYMLLCLAIMAGGFWGRVLFFSTPLIHLQSVLTIVTVVFSKLDDVTKNESRTGTWHKIKGLLGLSAVTFFGTIGFLYFQQRILGKFESYSDLGAGIAGTLQISALAIASMFVARSKTEAILYFVPLILFAGVLGGSRVNMIGFLILFYLGLKDRRYFHPILLTLYSYFAYKSVGFVENILEFGVGFV